MSNAPKVEVTGAVAGIFWALLAIEFILIINGCTQDTKLDRIGQAIEKLAEKTK